MDGVRQRRHVADADSGDDVSEVVREEETDLLLTHYSSSHDDSLSSQSSKYLTEDPTIRLRSAKEDKDKQSSISPKDQDDEGKRRPEQPCDEETLWDIFFEVFLPFIVAGLGMATTGITLNYVKHWPVFVEVSEIFILVPALLGLKGNLEMTLASRLSTQANLGHMDTASEKRKMIAGNLALTQAQALVVGQLAALFAILLSWVPQWKFDLKHGLLLCTSSVLTAAIASFFLSSAMAGVILLARRFHINPDNVATPIAASLGDLTTISLLAAISMFIFRALETYTWSVLLLLCLALSLIPLWWYISHHNQYTYEVLYKGWTPIIGAMVISSLGGLVLDHTIVQFNGIAAFQPVINGVGGNLVAVQASRLSTALHRVATPGHLPDSMSVGCITPWSAFCGNSTAAKTARVLLTMVIPGQIIFMLAVKYLQSQSVNVSIVNVDVLFAVVYLTAAIVQVALLLYLAHWLVNFLWWKGCDPDNAAIPCLTAVGDLLGTVLLAAVFYFLFAVGAL